MPIVDCGLRHRQPGPGRWLLCLGGLFLSVVAAGAAELKAGAAKVDITPPVGFPMWGYAARHDWPSVGVLDNLYARALVLEVGGQRVAIVSLDLGRPPTRQSTAAIRTRARADAGVGHLWLVASHTHHGPVLELDNWPTPKEPYLRRLEEKIGAVILTAVKQLRPARLGVAAGEVDFNRNRHSRLADKPLDRELLVLKVEDADGKPIALAVNWAAHPTVLDAKLRKFSADFPGALAGLVEKKTDATCLFLQGAAGDLSAHRAGAAGFEELGQALGQSVLELAGRIRCQRPGKSTLQVRSEDFQFKSRIDLGNPLVKAAVGLAFFPALVDFYEREYRLGIRPQLTAALLDGSIGFVGVSGEFFCSHSLGLKRRARLEHLFFLGYCNDYQQYFPTIEAIAEGGPGTEPTVAPAEIGAGERIMDRALIHLYQMRGQLPEPKQK